jgi:hypothetical protein
MGWCGLESSSSDMDKDLKEVGWGGMDWIRLAQDRDQWRMLLRTR